jgi:hypothetical protein
VIDGPQDIPDQQRVTRIAIHTGQSGQTFALPYFEVSYADGTEVIYRAARWVPDFSGTKYDVEPA